jgi:hypothetical protein
MTAPIRSMSELLAALCARRDELNISHETIDGIAGLQAGYTSKLLAPTPIKNLGPMSFGALLGALGMALVAVPDPDAVAAVEKRWQKRKRPQKLVSASISPSIDNQVPTEIQITPELQSFLDQSGYMRAIGLRGNQKRNERLSRWKRKVLARRAAKARWAKCRETA